MGEEEICVACLVTDVRMIRITKEIRNIYLEITGLQAADCVSKPCYICYLCHEQIQNCNDFKRKCLISQKLLHLIKSSKREITKAAVKDLDRKAHGLESCPVLKSSVTSIQPIAEERLNYDDPLLPVKTIKIEYDKEEACSFEPSITMEVVKNENLYEEPLKLSSSMFGIDIQDKKSVNSEEDKKIYVDIEKQAAPMDCVINDTGFDSDSEEKSFSDIEVKCLKTEKNLSAKKVKKVRNRRKGKKKSVQPSRVSKLCYIQRMNPEDQKLQWLMKQQSEAYTAKKYKCELCYTGFNSEAALKHHKNKHEYGVFGKLLCDLCKKYTSSKKTMTDHIYHHHFYKYNCKTCDHVSYSALSAVFHHQKKHETNSFTCHVCNKEFRNTHSLSAHKMRNHATVPCELCGHCFVNKQGLIYHKKYKHGVKDTPPLEVNKEDPLFCKVCQTLFADHITFCLHMVKSSKHSKDEAIRYSQERKLQMNLKVSRMMRSRTSKAVQCRVCPLVFPSFQQILKHYKSEHPGSQLPHDYICDVCGKTFKNPQLLEIHSNIHTKAVSFDCPECPKTFSCNANRTRHIKMAHREKDLICNHCDFRTGTKFDLKIHIQVVHMNIPYLPRIRADRKRIEKRRIKQFKGDD